jgi:hypothetical protein
VYQPGDRSVCGNCGRWRHEHYDRASIYVADRLEPACLEYFGVEPSGAKLIELLEQNLKQARENVAAAKAAK